MQGRFAFILLLAALPAFARGPQPGDVYREFASHQGGDDWRVTNPNVEGAERRKHLPNRVLKFSSNALAGATRAEAMLDRWSGHVQTKRPQIRFNGHPWLDVHWPGPAQTVRYRERRLAEAP